MQEPIELLSILYELSLSNLKFQSSRETASSFVTTFLSRKSLPYGAVWKIQSQNRNEVVLERIFSVPSLGNQKKMPLSLYESAFQNDTLHCTKRSLIDDTQLTGQFAYFQLGDFGILEFHDNNSLIKKLTNDSLNPYREVITQFTSSLKSSFAHELLEKEIAQRKAAEKRLIRNEEKFRRIIDSIELGLMEVDNDEIIQFANKPFLELTGYELDEVLGQKASALLIDESDREVLDEVNKQNESRRSGHSDVYEITIKDKRGNKKWAILSGAPNYNEDGELIGSIGIHMDITEEKKLKLENEFRETQLKKLFEKSLDALITINSQGRIVEWSPQAETVFGYTKEEILGQVLSEKIIPHNYRSSHESGMKHYHSTGEGPVLNSRIEISALRKSGEEFPIELTIFPVKYQNESFFTAFIRDISELKKSREDVENALKRQTELNDLKSQFISMTSHELRTPLTTIRSNTELLNYQLDNIDNLQRDKLKKNVFRIESNVERLNQLVNNILMIGQLDSKKVPFDPKSIDVYEFIQYSILPDFISRNQNVHCKMNGEAYSIKADQKLLGHIITNLIENAFKYSEEAEKSPELILDYQKDHMELHVKDFGIGIPEEDQEKLFQTFYRASNVGNIQGTGLGLAIVNEFVKTHDGNIKVESEVGKGTTFIVTFPK